MHVEENTFLEDYAIVKEENINFFEEVHKKKKKKKKKLIIEDPKIKIVGEIIKYPIIEKDLKVETVETIEEIEKEIIFKELDEIK